jgi:hypothetical protein
MATEYARIRRMARTLRQARSVKQWEESGRPGLPPFRFKAQVLREYAMRHRLRRMVETGTFQGDMAFALRDVFDSIETIELGPHLHALAEQRFRRFPQICCLLGDSAACLPKVLARLHEPALFWLDAHYSGGETAKGDRETPVISELESIFRHPVKGHVILIDDARCFDGTHDYPTLNELREMVKGVRPDLAFGVEHDIIRIVPSESAAAEPHRVLPA